MYFCNRNKKQKLRPVRLSVRTPGFHPGKRGSIPLRATELVVNKFYKILSGVSSSILLVKTKGIVFLLYLNL